MFEADRAAEALAAVSAGRIKGCYKQDKKTGVFQAAGWSPPSLALLN
ncbi:hypothetical protein HY380_01435 [Candidatus Saccharibacteria bacterium]|nr:hypothetical protein [Candidatus Saccharibacteria bacterium]